MATIGGVALSAALPGINGNVRDFCILGIVGVYVLGESIYASVTHRTPQVPAQTTAEVDAIKRRLTELGG